MLNDRVLANTNPKFIHDAKQVRKVPPTSYIEYAELKDTMFICYLVCNAHKETKERNEDQIAH